MTYSRSLSSRSKVKRPSPCFLGLHDMTARLLDQRLVHLPENDASLPDAVGTTSMGGRGLACLIGQSHRSIDDGCVLALHQKCFLRILFVCKLGLSDRKKLSK